MRHHSSIRSSFFLGALTLELVVPGLARAACGDGVLDDTEHCDDGNTTAGDDCSDDCTMACSVVGPAATEHTCLHGQFGPFVTVTAQAYPGTVLTNVNPVHTYFTVQLPGAPEENRSAVRYHPNVSGTFGLYLKQDYPIVVRDADGIAVPVLFEHAVSTCSVPDSLTWVRVFENLDEEQTYTLDIGPLASSSVSFAIEYLPEFTTWLYPDSDADGVGAAVDPIAVTWCAFPSSLSRFGDDCDDQDPESHPAFLTSPAAPEVCDGRDNDCDGDPDNGGALCAGHADGTLCVTRDGDTFCGCSANAHCDSQGSCENSRCEAAAATGGTSGTGGASSSGGGGAAPPLGSTGGTDALDPDPVAGAGAAGSGSPGDGTGGTMLSSAGSPGSEEPGVDPLPGGGFGGAAGSEPIGNEAEGGDTARDGGAGGAGPSAGGSASGGRAVSRGGRSGKEVESTVPDDATNKEAGCGCRLGAPGANHALLGAVAVAGLILGRRRTRNRRSER
jgi:MYXO-CTERM domain-containing protein